MIVHHTKSNHIDLEFNSVEEILEMTKKLLELATYGVRFGTGTQISNAIHMHDNVPHPGTYSISIHETKK